MTLDITQFYQSFFDEADELLAEMEQLLLGLDIDSPASEDLAAIFRAAHSIKGGGATFGFTALTETTHVLESLLDRARNHELVLRRDMIDAFLEAKDVLSGQIAAYRAETEPDDGIAAATRAKLERLRDESKQGVQPALDAATAQHKPSASAASAHMPDEGRLVAGVQHDDDANVETETSKDDEDRPYLSVTLHGVNESDGAQLIEELGNLGRIVARRQSGADLSVWMSTDVPDGDVIAVCGFVIAESQIALHRGAALPEQAQQPGAPEPRAVAPAVSLPAAATDVHAAADPVPTAHPATTVAPATVPAPASPARSARPAANSHGEGSSIRVGVEKVDQLINLVGELVITQAMLAETAKAFNPAQYDRLFNGLSQLERNARHLQEVVMSIRMMPMDYVFSRFPRVVRDLASKLGKEVELVTFGQSTELDKSLIERMVDPLTHLVRNSLDHGIETVDLRRASGKDPMGQLMLSASHQGGNIVIEVSDDGAGLHRDKILAKAVSQGMQVSDSMSDEEVWNLIFMPGFSTAEQVTDVSGRGVGMDVVKRNIQSMGGHVEISSRAGKGTTTRIVLPLTLAILNGMSVKVGNEVYILPLNFVTESLQPTAEDIYTVADGERVVRVRGEYLPLVELHKAFSVDGAKSDPHDGVVTIMQTEGRRFAMLVDDLVGQQQVVVKNIETNYRKVRGISAATILGDGSVALIVDVVALYRDTQQTHRTMESA